MGNKKMMSQRSLTTERERERERERELDTQSAWKAGGIRKV